MSFAFVFPGQGSQAVGMLASLAAEPPVRETFAAASQALGYDLWELSQSGPAERLDTTEFTQPAMLTAGVALWRLWRQRGGEPPAWVAGHSLGEFTALVCAGAVDLADAVTLVRRRGQLMQEAVPQGSGAMAAVLGLTDDQVREACRSAAQGAVVEAVNFNSPGQVVIAGERAAVARALEAARQLGAKRVLELPVSVPAHSALMRSAAERFVEPLAALALHRPGIAYLSAVDAAVHEDPADIRSVLERQLWSPVLWTATVQGLLAGGARALIECGPGKVLTGLNRRIERRPDVQYLSIEDEASLGAALTATSARSGQGEGVARAGA
jgi:[acyl-carrier-protein] S-malonyltransferase